MEKIAEVAALVADVQLQSFRDARRALAEITDSASRAVPGAAQAGITVVDAKDGVVSVAATDPHVVVLDEVQEREKDGPCLSAAWHDETVRIDDLMTEERWPGYCSTALNSTSFRAVLSVRMFTGERASGALNFFAGRPRAFSQESVELGLIFATHAAITWGMTQRDQQFRSALASRDVIGQAKGVLMERYDLDAVKAFELLKKLSQDTNVPVHVIAERLTSSRGASAS